MEAPPAASEWGPPVFSANVASLLEEPKPYFCPEELINRDFHDAGLKANAFTCRETGVQHKNLFEPCLRVVDPSDFELPTDGMINLLRYECPTMDWKTIILSQRQDSQLKHLRKMCEKSKEGRYQRFYCIEDVLYKCVNINGENYLTLVLPKHLIYDVIAQIHRQPLVGHQGVRRLYEFARRRFFSINLRRAVTEAVQTCSICMRYLPATTKRRLDKTPIKGILPSHVWHLDICVVAHKVLPGEKSKNLQFVTAVDSVTKYVVAWPAKLGYTQEDFIHDFFSRIIAPFGKPRGIVTDSEFHTIDIRKFCEALMISKLRIAPRSSKSNMAERMHRCLLRAIRIQRDALNLKPIQWDVLLYWGVLCWNHQNNASGKVPAELFLGRKQVAPWSCFHKVPFAVDTFSDAAASIIKAQHVIAEAMNLSQEYQDEVNLKSENYNIKANDFPPGTRVYVKAPLLNEHYKKLRERYRDVYIVTQEFPTACIVMPIRQNVKVDLKQTPSGNPGRLPALTPHRVDKSELKKCKTLTFYSRPLAREFAREFFEPYETADEYFVDPTWLDRTQDDGILYPHEGSLLQERSGHLHKVDPARSVFPTPTKLDRSVLPGRPSVASGAAAPPATPVVTKRGRLIRKPERLQYS